MFRPIWGVTLFVFLLISSSANVYSQDFNSYILQSVDFVNKTRAGGGYNLHKSFTRDLQYNGDVIPATDPSESMCVAAVVEIMVEAIHIYAGKHGKAIYSKIPVRAFTKGNLAGLRANIYQFEDAGSRGTGHTLDRFRLGQELPFEQLKAGDFINFNRTGGPGHAAVFFGYLDKSSSLTPTFSSDIIGFRYFSAQGKNSPDAGFAYRNAYFDGHCPTNRGSIRRDCGVIRSKNLKFLGGGRMWDPNRWDFEQGVRDVKEGVRGSFAAAFPDSTKAFVDSAVERAINAELNPVQETPDYFNGITTD